MATTTWDQKSGMSSATDVDNLESYAEQAEASKDAAAASATAAATSASEAAASVASISDEADQAAASAAAAATSATSASGSATTATTKAAEAATSADDAQTAQAAAETAKTGAETAQTAAETAQAGAETAETNAASSATAAQAAQAGAEAAYDSFDDRYLGAKASAPATDNDGDPLVTGALYYNTTAGQLYIWAGSAWDDAAFNSSVVGAVSSFNTRTGAVTLNSTDVSNASGMLTTNNLSDLVDAATARTNLGLGTAATTASTDYATAAQGALADSALQSSDIGVSVQGYSAALAGTTASYTTAEETKLAGIETGADVTDTANVTAAGALMDSEVTNLAAVKAFNPADYATAAQGALADSATQPGDNISTLTNDSGFTTNTGTVTSVSATVPAGFTVSGSPVTTSGTIAVSYDTGYQGFTTAEAALVASATQPGDNVSSLTNDAGYTTNTGTVTSVAATAGTGISVTGSPITSSGTLTITNTAPDQTVSLTAGSNVTITGTYPSFTIAASSGVSTTVGDVGTYAALFATTNASRNQGATLAGSSLRYSNFYAYGSVGYNASSPSGTWQCMGSTGYNNGSTMNNTDQQSTLWLRIS